METYRILSKKILFSVIKLLLLATLLSCSGCITYIGKDGPYLGRVVDKKTRQPLEGVVVVGNWGTAQWGSTAYYDTYETVTDKEGNFSISGQGVQVFSDLKELQLFVLKAGYEEIPGYLWNTVDRLRIGKEGDRIVIGLNKLSMDERKKRSITSSSAPSHKQKLFLEELNREDREIGRSPGNVMPLRKW